MSTDPTRGNATRITRPEARARGLAYAQLKPRPTPATVDVTCWCERLTVKVPTADVWAGRTKSCGLASCAPPA